MATKRAEKEEVEVIPVLEEEEVMEEVKEEVVEQSVEVEKLEAVKILEPVILKPKEVKVIPTQDLPMTYIGGKYYNFKKGVEIKVSLDAERVLRERDLIK